MPTNKRRPNGTASVGTTTDGRHYATIRLPDGTRPRRYGRTEAEALQKLKVLLADQEKGLNTADGHQKLSDYLNWWLAEQVKGSNRNRTYVFRESHIRVHLNPELGRYRLDELTAAHIQKFIKDSTAKGLAPRTVSHLRATLRAALNQAVGMRLIGHNPALYVKLPRIPRTKVRPLDPEEAVQMVEKLKSHRLGALFTVVLAVGLRSSEARGLTWPDIDWERGTLTARHQLERIDGVYQLEDELKNESSIRVVRLPQIAIATLKAHQTRQDAEREAAGDLWCDEWGLVFCDLRGRPLNGSSTTRTFHQMLAEVGVRDQRMHDLRHGCASLLIAAGANLKEVSVALGHSSTTITASLYWHLFEATEAKTASRMDAIFEPKVTAKVTDPEEESA